MSWDITTQLVWANKMQDAALHLPVCTASAAGAEAQDRW